jgi:hypothetical protein
VSHKSAALLAKRQTSQRGCRAFFAEECMELARTAKDAQAKAVLLHLAQVWVRLAEYQTADTEREDAS